MSDEEVKNESAESAEPTDNQTPEAPAESAPAENAEAPAEGAPEAPAEAA